MSISLGRIYHRVADWLLQAMRLQIRGSHFSCKAAKKCLRVCDCDFSVFLCYIKVFIEKKCWWVEGNSREKWRSSPLLPCYLVNRQCPQKTWCNVQIVLCVWESDSNRLSWQHGLCCNTNTQLSFANTWPNFWLSLKDSQAWPSVSKAWLSAWKLWTCVLRQVLNRVFC